MKYYNKILEAVNRGIKLALDDIEDDNPNSSLSQQSDVIDIEDVIKKRINFMKDVIDLGLPSGTCWFKYNFGVNYKKLDKTPEKSIPKDWFGNYYAWGELEPKHTYTRDNYKFYVKNYKSYDRYSEEYMLTKYSRVAEWSFNNKTDNLFYIQNEDDVIYQKFNNPVGIKFNIPTKEQFNELVHYTTNKYIDNFNEVPRLNGLLYTSKINGNSIFFPGTGNYDGASHEEKNSVTLWTSILSDSSHYAFYFYGLDGGIVTCFATNARYCGYPIRPVAILKTN